MGKQRASTTTYGRWHVARGEELVEAYEDGQRSADVVVDCEAIYLWKRAFRPPSHVRASPEDFVDWLSKLALVPSAEIVDKPLAHFAWLGSFQLRGAPLSGEKRETLLAFVSGRRNREWTIKFLSEVARHTAPLYVGETNRLAGRAGEHIRGDTKFGSRITASEVLNWADLDLYYYAIGAPRSDQDDARAKKRRTALEMLITGLTISGYVERRG